MYTVYSNELYHHGIKGQKWGVRRFQNPDGTLTAAGKERLRSSRSGQQRRIVTDGSVGMSDDAFALVMEAGFFATTFAVMALYARAMKAKLTKQYNEELDDMKDESDFKSISELPRLKYPQTPEESMKVVNPGYPAVDRVQNCMLCTTAMAMREKGYDVIANPSTHGFYEENMNRMWSKGGEFKKIKAKNGKQLISTLEKEGNGAYGNLTVVWNMGGGHSIFWKNVNGKVHIYDGQSGEEYDVSKPTTSKLLNSIRPNQCSYARLDNAEPNDLVLAALMKKT